MQHPDFHSHPQQTIFNVFKAIDQEVLSSFEEGGCVVLCAIILEKRLYIVNLGDSRAVLLKKDKSYVQLSKEHTPESIEESDRIEALGGYVIKIGDKARVQGSLAVSRSIGDRHYKPFVSSDPEISVFDIEENDQFLVLATDGLWNVYFIIRMIFYKAFLLL